MKRLRYQEPRGVLVLQVDRPIYAKCSTKRKLLHHMSLENPKERQEKNILSAMLSDKDFHRLSEFIYNECGIHLPPAKKTMVEGRLRKRLRALGLGSFRKYCDYLFTSEGMKSECVPMIDLVTTNKTDFFREPEHFEHMVQTVLPDLIQTYGLGIRQELRVWSSACSSGEEPYTLAMVLQSFGERIPGFRFSILATDISTIVLEKAQRGIYDHDRVEPVPLIMRRKYLMRSKDKSKALVRIVPELRTQVKFRRLNLMDEDFGIRTPMAIIFCRNVIIYFDKMTQEILLNRLCRHLIPGGYLFMGHSETLHGLNVPLVQPARGMTTIYKRL